MNIQHTVMEFAARVGDEVFVTDFLKRCTIVLEVVPSSYHIDMFPANGLSPIGFTATVKFQESYIAFDTWPEHEYCHFNAVSCKLFSELAVESLIGEMFSVKQSNIIRFDVFKRGAGHYTDARGVAPSLSGESPEDTIRKIRGE